MAHGGILPVRYAEGGKNELTPKQKGIRQGTMLMLCTLLVVPVVSIITTQLHIAPRFFIPLSAFICFIGGLLRIIYAALFESEAPRAAAPLAPAPTYVPPAELAAARRPSFLPPQQSTPVTDWRGRRNTAELVAPSSSVTENTTRLLDEKKMEPPSK